MARSVSARRYAQAVYQLAEEKNEVEKWLDDLAVLAASVHDEVFIIFANSPKVESEKKSAVIKEAFGEIVGELAINLVSLLAGRGAVADLPAIEDAFQEFVDADRGLERAEIVSAVELTGDQHKNISDALSVLIGKELTVVTRVDESLLGGFVARVGDRLIDGSIRTRFEDMRRELVRGV